MSFGHALFTSRLTFTVKPTTKQAMNQRMNRLLLPMANSRAADHYIDAVVDLSTHWILKDHLHAGMPICRTLRGMLLIRDLRRMFGHTLFTSKRPVDSCLTTDFTNDSAPIPSRNINKAKSTVNEMITMCALPPSSQTSRRYHTLYIPRFYLLPKIHKPNNPDPPIVPACSCPTEHISTYLEEVLAPSVRSLPT